ncbi:MAG: paraquat-inducible protein A [Pseudomonadota bacterium]
MHRYDLISCHDCGTLHRKRALRPRERACCIRCSATLYRGTSADLGRIIAITLGALLVYLIAQCCTIVELEFSGMTSSATLLGAIGVLWAEQMQVVALMVLLFTVLFPLVELGALLYIAVGLRAGRRLPGFHGLLRAVQTARRWGMTEVLLIGILITVIKMTSLAEVVPKPGLFAFGALTLMLAVAMSFDPRLLWEWGDRLDEASGALPPAPDSSPLPYRALDDSALLACHACGLVNRAHGERRPRCARCASVLHRRLPDSVNRTWALLITAALLYIPANLLPVMYTHSLFGTEDDTIMSGVVFFWTSGSQGLAIVIFIASVVVPMLKLAVLSLLAFTTQRGSLWRLQQRTRLYRMIEFIGRWSMLDIFVVTLTVALVRFHSVAAITAGPGALAFGAVVVLTMLASAHFDPRLMWDRVALPGDTHV